MLEFIVGVIVGVIASAIAVKIISNMIIKKFQRALNSVVSDLEEKESLIIRARVEEDNGVFYFYNNDSNEFLVQGSNLQELLEHLESRKPGTTVQVVDGDKETIAHLKALAR